MQDMGKPEVYLDMDGVIADFFTEYAKLAGIESGNYRDIPPAKTDPTLNKMIGTDFFARLPKCRNADALVDLIVKTFGTYNICSSPLRGDHANSEKQKKICGIKYQADEDNLQVIVQGIKRAFSVIKGEEKHDPQKLKSLDRSNGNLIATSGDKDAH